jgi:hypothetical protein
MENLISWDIPEIMLKKNIFQPRACMGVLKILDFCTPKLLSVLFLSLKSYPESFKWIYYKITERSKNILKNLEKANFECKPLEGFNLEPRFLMSNIFIDLKKCKSKKGTESVECFSGRQINGKKIRQNSSFSDKISKLKFSMHIEKSILYLHW